MDVDEPFSADFYKHLLSSLVLNSRTLITELTTIAERSTDHASEIVNIIEARIQKCLPQYKLFAIYLLDLICKNIGNPYNLLFGPKLYKIFTETYLVVTDTPTRQSLINLFKTWATTKTSTGQDLFPLSVIQKIEEFIIKATSISQGNQPNIPIKLTPDMLLREGNCLLQYIIMLDNELEKLPEKDPRVIEFRKTNNTIRNNIISLINNTSDSILSKSKQEFENNVSRYHIELLGARKLIDDQSFLQAQFIGNFKQEEAHKKIEVNVKLAPDLKFFNFDRPFDQDGEFQSFLKSWGKPIVDIHTEKPPNNGISVSTDILVSSKPASEEGEEETKEEELQEPLSKSLGISLDSISFVDSVLGSPKNEVSKPQETDNLDSYDPERSFSQEFAPLAGEGISTNALKRKNSSESNVAKKVRFDI